MPAGGDARMRALFLVSLVGLFALSSSSAQTPAPVLMQPVTAAPATVATPAPTSVTNATDSKDMMQLLQEMQATNAETIKKQEAALQTLDTLQKAAEELKIFSKRG